VEEYESDKEEEDCTHYSDEEDLYGSDHDQSCAEKEDITVGVIMMLQSRVKLLDNWSNAMEQETIKETMRTVDVDGQVFFDVDRVIDALACW
jgi:hypothetical protein